MKFVGLFAALVLISGDEHLLGLWETVMSVFWFGELKSKGMKRQQKRI